VAEKKLTTPVPTPVEIGTWFVGAKTETVATA
jgi:hypothetical protein